MTEVAQALRDMVDFFERMSLPYAVMGGIAVRTYGREKSHRGEN